MRFTVKNFYQIGFKKVNLFKNDRFKQKFYDTNSFLGHYFDVLSTITVDTIIGGEVTVRVFFSILRR